MIGKQIESILKNTTAIAALVGTRIHPVSAIDNSTPSIYYIIKCLPHYNKGGQQTTAFEVEILTMAKNYNDSWALSLLIKQAFELKRRKTVESVDIIKSEIVSITDDYEFNLNSFGQIIKINITTATI